LTRRFRFFRLWGKKRGDRRTGSRLWGGVSEAAFFAALLVVGAVGLAALPTWQLVHELPADQERTLWQLVLRYAVFGSFLVIGLAGVVAAIAHAGSSAERRSSRSRTARRPGDAAGLPPAEEYPTIPRDNRLTDSPGIVLKYRLPLFESVGWRIVGSMLFCLMCVALAAVLTVRAVEGFLEREQPWLLTMFLIPFLAMAVWATYFFLNQLLLATAIGPTGVEISDLPLWPGRRYDVFVSQGGRLNVERLELQLTCHEHATYSQGTNLRVESVCVYCETLFEREDFRIEPAGPFQQQMPLTMPTDCMHSFESPRNAVRWRLVVRAVTTNWGSFEREFGVVAYPAPRDGG